MDEALASAHSFVRALKAATDPPRQDWPTKLYIAKTAWENKSVRIPRKAGIILEWLLPLLAGTKVKTNLEVEPILSPSYWEVLADILSNPGDTPIAPIISRFSVASSLNAVLHSYHSLSPESAKTLFTQIHRSVTILWPRSTHSLDVLSESFWASVSLITESQHRILDPHVIEIITLLWAAFRQNFGTASTNQKKKIFNIFSQHINDWLSVLQSDMEGISTEEMYQIGKHILYNLDSLKSALDSKQNLLSSIFLNDQLKLNQATRRCLLKVLPRLFRDYLTSLRHHQLAIFPPSFNVTQVQGRLAEIGTNSAIQIILYVEKIEDLEDQSQLWSVILEMLVISEQEEIATTKSGTEWRSHLCDLRQRVLSLMDSCWDETRAPLLRHALDILSFLHRVEPELIDPILPDILGRIALSSPKLLGSAFGFWKQLLSFYSKTRTLHTFMGILQGVLKSSFSLVSNMNPQNVYGILMRSPLMSFTFLDELGHALLTYISPGQAKAIIENTGSVLKDGIESYSSNTFTVKRRKVSKDPDSVLTGDGQFEMDIVALSFVVRLNSVIVEALTRRNLPDYTQNLSDCINTLDDCISTVLDRLFDWSRDYGSKDATSSKKRKRTEISFTWSDQCFFATLYQLSYSLFIQYGHGDGSKTRTMILNHTETMSTFMRENMIPELHLEMGRWCIYAGLGDISSQDREDKYLDIVLDYIEKYGYVEDSKLDEKGFSYCSSWHVAFGLLAFLLETHLSSMDAFASRLQLGRIVRILVRQVDRNLQPQGRLSMGAIVDRLSQTASFWEMQNIRAMLQAVLEEETSLLTSKHVPIRPDMDRDLLKQSMQCSPKNLAYTSDIYKFLLRFPSNYLSKKLRDDLITKALNADVFIEISRTQGSPAAHGAETGTSFRAFLSKCWNEQPSKLLGEIASDPPWVQYVFGEKFQGKDSEGVQIALLKLILQNALKGEASSLDVILRMILNHKSNLDDGFIPPPLMLIINSITDGVERTRLPESSIKLLDEIRIQLECSLKSAVGQLLQNNVLSSVRGVVRGWKAFLSLSIWILGESSEVSDTRVVSQRLFRRVVSSCTANPNFRGLYPDILSIAILQSKSSRLTEASDFAEVVAGYFLISQEEASAPCDGPLSRFCRELRLDRYEALLDILGEYLEKRSTKIMLNAALHASILFLREAPEKSSKISSTYVSRCLRVLTNTEVSELSSPDVGKIFEFLRFQCSDRAVALKSLDVGEILTITHSLTDGVRNHDPHTSYPIFHAMVSMLDDLVRLRHDLLNPFFPPISKILRRLLLLLRTTRPQLGSKQYRLIADAYPRWVNPSESFSTSEGTALARLLTSFVTKTSIRSRGSYELPKVTSLARSFARHAPYVLLAYLEAISDPLTYIPVQVRKELQPGLFALCAMTGEHGRDTLMIQNLNVEQKALLKTLWGDYAKQKYTGKG